MENIDETVDGPAVSGQAIGTQDETATDTSLALAEGEPDHNPAGPDVSVDESTGGWYGYNPWVPPAYVKIAAKALEACSLPGAVYAAEDAADKLRRLCMGTPDGEGAEILKGHTHVLNAVFAGLIAASMEKPAKNLALLQCALKAQELCSHTVNSVRMLNDLEFRREALSAHCKIAYEKIEVAQTRVRL